MGAQIAIPTVLVLSLTLATLTQLQDIAESSSEKAIKYAEDMNGALDCAYQARPLDECSPDLFSEDFKEETARTQAILADLQAQQPGHLEAKQQAKERAATKG